MSFESSIDGIFSAGMKEGLPLSRSSANNQNISFSDIFSSLKGITHETSSAMEVVTENPAQYKDDYLSNAINSAKSDAELAEKLLQFHAGPSCGEFPLIDISNLPTVRYSISGELQTPESEAYFSEVYCSALTERTEIVRSEREKGTPASEILQKVLAFNGSLPQRYKDMANISY
jgi:hypothetical protein